MDEATIPEIITRFAEQITADCGHTANAVVMVPYQRWQIVVLSPRVHLTIDYARRSRGRYTWAHSTLSLDHRRIPLETSYDDCLWLLKHPDSYPAGRPDGIDFDEPVYPLPTAELADAPASLQPTLRRITRVDGVRSWHLGHAGPRWTLTSQFDDNVEIRKHWMVRLSPHSLKERIYTRRTRSTEMFLAGIDVTDALDTRTQALFDKINKAGKPHEAAPGVAPTRGESQGARSNAVEVRKSTVVRT